MSGLVVLFIIVAENPCGSIHPTVAAAVMTVPTHGVIALVLAWHERVESTLIRVRRAVWAGRGRGLTVSDMWGKTERCCWTRLQNPVQAFT